MQVNCELCGCVCDKAPSKILAAQSRGGKLYCSRKCRDTSRTTKIEVPCYRCGIMVVRNLCDAEYYDKLYCSRNCSTLDKITRVLVDCCWCGEKVEKLQYQLKQVISKKYFCNNSCATKYKNLHTTNFCSRSQLEQFIESALKDRYPNLNIIFNDRCLDGKELDIHIPVLNIGIEINGIGHYLPIYGDEAFLKRQQYDLQKIQICKSRNIDFHVIDTKDHRHPNLENSQPYINQVIEIIDRALNGTANAHN